MRFLTLLLATRGTDADAEVGQSLMRYHTVTQAGRVFARLAGSSGVDIS
jgi:hypothetical protein